MRLGIQFDRRYRQRGVLVGGIDQNSPAARSVLKAGDIIRSVGRFDTRSGVRAGPYRVDRPDELGRIVSWVRPGSGLPLQVVRGSNFVDVVIIPE